MRRAVVAGCGILLCAVLASTILLHRSISEPTISVTPDIVNFGYVDSGGPHYSSVTIRNEGKALLKLENVVIPCPCIKAKISSSLIKPGESATLELSATTPLAAGRWEMVLALETNDSAHRVVKIPLRARVGVRVQFLPSDPAVELQGYASVEQSVSVIGTSEHEHFTITGAKTSDDNVQIISVNRDDSRVGVESGWLIKYRISPKGVPNWNASLSIDTNDAKTKSAELQIRVQESNGLRVSPALVLFHTDIPSEKVSVDISGDPPKECEIERVKAPSWIKVETKTRDTSGEVHLFLQTVPEVARIEKGEVDVFLRGLKYPVRISIMQLGGK